MDTDPRDLLAVGLERLTSADLPRLAAVWTPALSDELAGAHLVLVEHERDDFSHVLGGVLDRVPELAALVTEDELLTGDRRAMAERALEVLEGATVAVNAADLLPRDRARRLAEPWLSAEHTACGLAHQEGG